jgi:predicted dehydrogenase
MSGVSTLLDRRRCAVTNSGDQSIDPLLDLDYRVRLSSGSDLGIAIVGCGGIVNYAHLPAYAAHDLNIMGCSDLNPEVAQRTAADFNIPRVYESVEIVKAAEDAGVLLAVNQQFRWSRAIKASKTLIDKGWIGQPTEVSIEEMRAQPMAAMAMADQVTSARDHVLLHSLSRRAVSACRGEPLEPQ